MPFDIVMKLVDEIQLLPEPQRTQVVEEFLDRVERVKKILEQ